MELFHPLTFSRSNTLSILSDISSGAGSGRGSDVFSVQSASSDDTTAAPPTPPFPPKLPIAYDVDSQVSILYRVCESRANLGLNIRSFSNWNPVQFTQFVFCIFTVYAIQFHQIHKFNDKFVFALSVTLYLHGQ